MEELPIPLSRVELYLAKAAGMDVTPPEPKSRLELFLAKIAGMDVETPLPLSLKEQWLSCVYYGTTSDHPMLEGAYYIDNQKVDVRYLTVASGVPGATLPAKPHNRKEQYWAMIAIHGPIHGVLKYVTGTNITLTDVVSGIEELQFVYGDTFQQTYTGKNLFNVYGVGGTSGGDNLVSYTAENEELTVTQVGTNGNGYVWVRLDKDKFLGKELTLSVGEVTSYGGSTGPRIRFTDQNGANIEDVSFAILPDREPTKTFSVPSELPSEVTELRLYIYVNSSNVAGQVGATSKYTKLQIEVGSTPTTYEPYVGGVPAPNPDYPQEVQTVTGEQTVTVTGKNAWNMNSITTNGSSLTITKIDNIYELHWTGGFIADLALANNLNSTKTYTLSFKHKGAALALRKDGTSSALLATNTDSDYAEYTYTFTNEVSLNLEFIRRTGTSNVTAFVKDFQIEQGLTATAYEPYQGQTYTIDLGTTELCKIGDYQDYIYKSGDDWYVHKEISNYQLTGNENWNRHSSGIFYDRGNSYAANGGKVPANDNTLPNIVSEYFTQGTQNQVFSNRTPGVCVASDNTSNPRFYVNGISTTEDFKAMITTKQPVLYFPLATPTDTKITDATLVGQLDALDSAVLPKPIAYITVNSAGSNLPSPLKISYYGRGA